jgi:alpha-L-fucosidase
LYATVLKWPENGKVKIRSLGSNSTLDAREIRKVELLGGSGDLLFERSPADLEIVLPDTKPSLSYAIALKITMAAS